MFLKRRLAASVAVFAALAIGPAAALAVVPQMASGGRTTITVTGPLLGSLGCPYPNPAWGCGPYGAARSGPASPNLSSEPRVPVISRRPEGSSSSVTIVGCGASCMPGTRPVLLK
jgi:hypothetical protein